MMSLWTKVFEHIDHRKVYEHEDEHEDKHEDEHENE